MSSCQLGGAAEWRGIRPREQKYSRAAFTWWGEYEMLLFSDDGIEGSVYVCVLRVRILKDPQLYLRCTWASLRRRRQLRALSVQELLPIGILY